MVCSSELPVGMVVRTKRPRGGLHGRRNTNNGRPACARTCTRTHDDDNVPFGPGTGASFAFSVVPPVCSVATAVDDASCSAAGSSRPLGRWSRLKKLLR